MYVIRNALCSLCHVTQERMIKADEGQEPSVTCILCGGKTILSKPEYHKQADTHWRRESGEKDVIGGY